MQPPKIEIVSIDSIHKNPDNPRIIKDENFKKLKKSIKEFPQMMMIRPVIVKDNMILGGNMRYEACLSIGKKKIPIIRAENLTEDQVKEFIIKDNLPGGEWDWQMLANEWDQETLIDWGFEDYMFGIPAPEEEDKEKQEKEEKTIVCPECGHEFSA